MENSNGSLTCSINLEWNKGPTQQKVSQKKAFLKLIRNEFKAMFLEISAEKFVTTRLQLKGISVHNKFMNEGKASIKFPENHCTLFLSNSPPAQLMGFLRTLFVKMTGNKGPDKLNTSLRKQLLSNKPNSFEEISPVTVAEIDNAKSKISKSTSTTPSPSGRKRKSINHDNKAPLPKKQLYSSSPVSSESLTAEQQEVLDSCLAKYNVFFTGSAGTGKSYLLKRIIAALPPEYTIATASTGVAACHIGGITLHQFAGIGIGEASLERSYEMASKPAVAQIWRKCQHLIIDEISMVDGKYFEKVEAVARRMRKNEKPFGGIQLIVCGDFLQLPPVNKGKENISKNSNNVQFCFQTAAWRRCVQRSFELTKIYRQSDNEFIDILNNLRIGNVSDTIIKRLMATSKQKIDQNGIIATRLCSHTQEANQINERKLSAIESKEVLFEAEDSDQIATKLLNLQTPVPGKLVLKIGAQVMLLKNINITSGLVNGARGVVIDFRDNLPVVRFRNQREYVAKHETWVIKTAGGATMTRKQIPLRLGWAFSIHKSQGLTLDCVEMSLAKVFEAGQAYVALSRAQSLDSLRVLDFNASQVWANPDVLKFYKNFQKLGNLEYIPLGKKNVQKSSINKSKILLNKKLLNKPILSIS